MIRQVSSALTGGIVGTLAAFFFLWLLNRTGFTGLIKVRLHPGLYPALLYPRLIWGGICGLLLLLPIMPGRVIQRGMLISLVPAILLYFVTFPDMGRGFFGLGYGMLTPVLVLVVSLFWGVVASKWYEHGR